MHREGDSNHYWIEAIESIKRSTKFKSDFYNNGYEKTINNVDIPSELAAKIKQLCKNNQFLMYTFLVAGISIELYKYSLTKGVAVGILGHKISGQDEIIRNKVLPLGIKVDAEYTCKEYMKDLRAKILKVYEMQDDLSLEYLKSKTICNDPMDISPISIGLKGFHSDKIINYVQDSSKNEMAISVDLREEKLQISVTYNAKLYRKKTIEGFTERYLKILKDIAANFEDKILFIDMISEYEKNRVLKEFNNTEVDFKKNKTISEVFQQQVSLNPENIAVVFQERQLTYGELNEKSNQIAETLRNKGVKANTLVGIMLERSPEMIIALLAVLKAGGAYLPIDYKYPQNRIQYILDDSKAQIILTSEALKEKFRSDTDLLYMEDSSIYRQRRTNLEVINNEESLAYVIYTSGSTGRPKGVMISL